MASTFLCYHDERRYCWCYGAELSEGIMKKINAHPVVLSRASSRVYSAASSAVYSCVFSALYSPVHSAFHDPVLLALRQKHPRRP
jgi:hypothetical protein